MFLVPRVADGGEDVGGGAADDGVGVEQVDHARL